MIQMLKGREASIEEASKTSYTHPCNAYSKY